MMGWKWDLGMHSKEQCQPGLLYPTDDARLAHDV